MLREKDGVFIVAAVFIAGRRRGEERERGGSGLCHHTASERESEREREGEGDTERRGGKRKREGCFQVYVCMCTRVCVCVCARLCTVVTDRAREREREGDHTELRGICQIHTALLSVCV